MDIRNWFVPSKSSLGKSGDKQPSKNFQQSSPKKSSKPAKKRRIIESDSDEEPLPKPKKAYKKNEEISKNLKSTNSKKEVKPETIISPKDFFGSAAVICKGNKPHSKKKKMLEDNHDDEDFNETLLKINEKEKLKIVEKPKEKQKVIQQEKSSDKTNGKTPKKKRGKAESHVALEIIPKPQKNVKKVVQEKEPPKKKGNAGYASYLGREGPRALGSKEIPEGEEDCLTGLTFVVTGVLESLDRDETTNLIQKYGGRVTKSLSRNTTHVVIGREAGASKLQKAENLGTKQLDEDGLLKLIETRPGIPGTRKVKAPKEDECVEMDLDDIVEDESKPQDQPSPDSGFIDAPKDSESQESIVEPVVEKNVAASGMSMWVDKYKPTSLKQVIGQKGEKSNAQKLSTWLTNWAKNRQLNKKPLYTGRFNAADDGSGHKAALLSGPPGIGKTTCAQLVCKEAGFDYFELNASDTRSKKNLQQCVSQLLGSTVLFGTEGGVTAKHVIIMDEVDGMAGNEDRGGMQELIAFIKMSKVPIMCICNDRNHMKIRSLSNHCFDLRFQKPRVEQIKAAMLSVAYKEGLKIPPDALHDIIVGSNQDIRQILHNLSMWSANCKNMSSEKTKHDVGKGTKHIKMGPFDVLREVFTIGNNPKATILDKSDLFFHDYSMVPLFVQENYVQVMPSAAEGDKKKHLKLLSEAAASISTGDLVEKQIRSHNNWNLLPTQAIFASVIPGELLKGHLRTLINFPAWLGKNSNRNHMDRILQELHMHMKMRISGNKTDVALEYLPLLKRALTKPLVEKETEGIRESLNTMEEYFLLREDFDSIVELSLWPNQMDPRTKIATKVKTAFTKTYNKECSKNPYATTNVKKKKSSNAGNEVDEENATSEEEDDSLENDAMVKVKKQPKKEVSKETKATKGTKKGKGKK